MEKIEGGDWGDLKVTLPEIERQRETQRVTQGGSRDTKRDIEGRGSDYVFLPSCSFLNCNFLPKRVVKFRDIFESFSRCLLNITYFSL